MEFEGSTEDMLVMLLDAGFEPTAYEAILLWRHAACRGYTSVAQRFLLEEWPVDFKIPEVQIKVSDEGPGDIYDTTALMHACESGHRDLFHLLLANGANVRFRDTLKQFPLYLAAQARYCTYASDAKDYEEIFDALLRTDAQKDRNAIIPGEQDWKWEVLSPLGIAVQSQQPGPVRMLLQAGADPNLGNSLGQTPLHVACTTLSASDDDHVEIIDLLLRHGAKVDAVTNHGWTPLGRVANLGVSSRACFRLLDAGAMVDIGGGKLDTALHAAARHDVSGELILRALIARSGDVNNMNGMYGTVLLAAMDRPRGGPEHDKALLSIVNLLIQHGVDINLTPSECRKSAIELAAEYGHAMVMDRLMRQGAKVNSEFSIIDIGSMKFRNSSLSTVSIYKPQIFNLLLFKGAPVESDCFLNDKSILEEACSGEGPLALETVKILLSHGADVNRRGPLGVTPLHRACFGLKQDVVSLLIDSGADCTAHCESYGVPLHSLCAGIVKQFSSPERKAAYNCILNILIDGNGLKLDAMDGDGASPLHKLAASTAESRYPADGSEKLVLTAMNQLLDLAQPEESRYIRTPDSSGRTLIHIAASAGDGEMLELLLNRSITDDVSQESLNSLRDNKGHTPLHCAIEKEHIDACKLLLRSATSDQALTPQVTEELRQFAAKHDNAHLVRIIRELSPGSPHGSPRDEYPS
ncbi:ankyrin [Patellaria atrata CBS 101060]|uniref:Ankyrin n=1 Tax=Patellaria atrata CBS 101060 TaxID=1346257 RepID=A0A9P4S6A4_9PEZI|nr:ankyrin [Patellaria atrata CBS 101060]